MGEVKGGIAGGGFTYLSGLGWMVCIKQNLGKINFSLQLLKKIAFASVRICMTIGQIMCGQVVRCA